MKITITELHKQMQPIIANDMKLIVMVYSILFLCVELASFLVAHDFDKERLVLTCKNVECCSTYV